MYTDNVFAIEGLSHILSHNNLNLYFCRYFQSIPADMEFDPNSNPPCYKTKDEVSSDKISSVKKLQNKR